jgi:glycosyltransferase involved in cell wall biosynthesis
MSLYISNVTANKKNKTLLIECEKQPKSLRVALGTKLFGPLSGVPKKQVFIYVLFIPPHVRGEHPISVELVADFGGGDEKQALGLLYYDGFEFSLSTNTPVSSTLDADKKFIISSTRAYFTICARNFLAYAVTLYDSLIKSHGPVDFYVGLCDSTEEIDLNGFDFQIIPLADLGNAFLFEMAERYSITEFNTAIKPSVFRFLFDRLHYEEVIYLDPDIFVNEPLLEITSAFDSGYSAVVTPHITYPSNDDAPENAVDEALMCKYGVFNLGFFALKNTEENANFISWWERTLRYRCVIDYSNGIFVDQKWVDLLVAFVENVRILRHPGYNVAYWNLPQRKVTYQKNRFLVNDRFPLVFAHFSGVRVDEPTVFSRHSTKVTLKNAGDLALIHAYYIRLVERNGHSRFRLHPYAFNWDGAKNFNEHTPRVFDNSTIRLVPREKSINDTKILYIDWPIPTPDKDAGSVTAFLILKILRRLGARVSFLAVSQQFPEPYCGKLSELGVEIVKSGALTITDWLTRNAGRYDCFIFARGPVCFSLIDFVVRENPEALRIFNTVDLHYVRETRAAQLAGNARAMESAQTIKKQELKLFRECDATIVLSNSEVDELLSYYPSQCVRVIPLVFEDIRGASSLSDRNGLIFIGGFLHKPNVDAAIYLLKDLWPAIHEKYPDLTLYIIGAEVPDVIVAFNGQHNVVIAGHVPELTTYFDKALASLAPLRFGAGIKGKVGTSFCYGVPVVGSRLAFEGMGLMPGEESLVAESVEEYIEIIGTLRRDADAWEEVSANCTRFAQEMYSVSAMERRLRDLFSSAKAAQAQFLTCSKSGTVDLSGRDFSLAGRGWSYPEQWGRWNNCNPAYLYLKLPSNKGSGVEVGVAIKLFFPRNENNQKVSIKCNTNLVFEQVFERGFNESAEIVFYIPPTVITAGGGKIIMEIHLEKEFLPQDYAEIGESRRIGILLTSLRYRGV